MGNMDKNQHKYRLLRAASNHRCLKQSVIGKHLYMERAIGRLQDISFSFTYNQNDGRVEKKEKTDTEDKMSVSVYGAFL